MLYCGDTCRNFAARLTQVRDGLSFMASNATPEKWNEIRQLFWQDLNVRPWNKGTSTKREVSPEEKARLAAARLRRQLDAIADLQAGTPANRVCIRHDLKYEMVQGWRELLRKGWVFDPQRRVWAKGEFRRTLTGQPAKNKEPAKNPRRPYR